MNKYETVYIITPELEMEAIKATIEKFNGIIAENGGTVENFNEWGKQRLAYPIDYKTEGYYVLVNFEGPSELPKEFERKLKNDENIIRFIVVRKDK